MTLVVVCILCGVAAGAAAWTSRARARRLVARYLAWWRALLDAAGLGGSARAWALGSAATGILAGAGAWLASGHAVFIVLAPAGLGAALAGAPRWIDARRRTRIESQLPRAAQLMASSFGAGLSFAQGFERVADAAPEPTRSEFASLSRMVTGGMSVPDALGATRARLRLPAFDLFAAALLTNRELGGDASWALTRLSAGLGAIDRMRQRMHAATARGRHTIRVLAFSPLVMQVLVWVADPAGVEAQFASLVGWTLLAAAAVVTALGVLWARAIVTQTV